MLPCESRKNPTTTEPTPALNSPMFFRSHRTRMASGTAAALDFFAKALDADPKVVAAHLGIAQILERAGRPDDALDAERRVEVDWVLSKLQDPATVLVDARSAGEYAAGHIPGARSFDWQDNVQDGRLIPREQLEAIYAELPPEATLVTYCQSGSRASMAYFVLRHLGFEDVRLYDGSMAEWSRNDGLPMVRSVAISDK